MQANQNWIMLTVFALISSVIISTGAYADTSNIALGASYTLTPAPDTAYPDSGGELTDGAFGDPANPYDPAWMAWGFYEPTIILDLGESRTLAGITVHCLNDPLWGIILPSIVVSYSADGETYATIGPMQQAAGTLTLPTSATTRYIRFAVDRDQWAFIDEIEVFSETEPVPVETIPLMAIVPASQDAAPGDTVTAGIMLDDVENLYSFEFQLSYDPAILMFGSMTPGTLLGSDGHPITCLGPSQLGPGTVMYSCIRELFPPFSGVSGSGLLATAHFTAIGDGTSPLALTGVTLANASNIMQSMAHGTEDGAVTVTTPPAPGQLTERRILLIVTATDPDKEEYSRFLNLMDGLGYAYDIIEDVEIAQTDLPSHPLVILYGDSLEFLEISAQAEDGIIGAIQAGTNVLWIGNGITGSQTSAALADAFGITYGSHDPASVLGADKVLYRDIDGNLDVFPIYDEYVIAVCPKAGTQVLAGFIDQDADLILPAVTRNQEDVDAGQAVYVALDAFSYWKSENEPFTWGRAELITKLIWQLQGSGMAGIHPFPGAYDAASIVRVEDISPSGEAMGQTDPEWVARFQRMVDLYDQAGQPLSIGTIPVYEDPYNEEHHPWASTQNNIPALKAVVEDAVADGACLIVHGYDHQDGTGEDDVSGVDWEVWDEDSDTWMSYTEQLQVTSQGRNEIAANFAYDSKTWETPHYKGNHDTYAAAAAAGFSYFSESDTKIWPNRFGYLNVADGSLISIPETAFDFPEFGTVEEWQTYARKQEDGILARMLRMDGIFFYFIHNHNDYQLDAAQQLLDALEGKQVWKTTVEEMGDWWSTREHISIETAADPAGSRIVATVAYQGGAGTAGYPPDDVTVAFRLPDGASFVGATVDSQPATRTRTVTKAGIAFAFVMFSLPDDGTPVEVQASYAQQASSGSFADLVPGCAWTGCSASCDAALYDEDRDLIPNGKDRCPGTAAGAIAGSEGCTGSEGSIEPPPSTIPDCSNVALGLPYTLSPAPTAPYVDDGTKLTDGLYGSDVPSDGRWVGWGYDEPRIDIDLGSAQPIRQLRFSSLSNPIWGINLPLITASYSLDGISYSVLSGSFTDGEDDLVYDFSETQMRYVRFTVVRNVWAFVDEIEVCDTSDGGGDPDPDSDGDAVTDSDDQCPGTPAGTPVDDDGCPVRTDGGDLIPTKITWNNNLANYTDSVTGWAANVGDSCTWAPVPLRIDFFAPHGVLEETFYATISPWLQPGDERGSQVFFSPDWCGEYTVRLTVDYGDIFSELDETNNMAEYPWLVEGPTCACPDEDGDGVCDDDDLCPGTPENEVANPEEGCSCSQYDWDDGNECTYDWCEDGDEYHDPLDGESCGEHVSCPADHCEGMTFIDWSAGGYGVCEEDSCNPYHCAFTAHPDDVRCGWCPDEDDDGVCDDDDLCPGTPAGEPVNDDGCSCSQIVWVDGNECTYDWCEAGVGHHDPLTGTPCGALVDCPDDYCEGTTFIDWSADSRGTCDAGVCTPFQCAFTAHPDDPRCGWCADEDQDGVCDEDDDCPGTPAGMAVDDEGCACVQKTCSDGNACTDDSCDVETAACVFTPNDDPCGAWTSCPPDICLSTTYREWSPSGYGVCVEGSCVPRECSYTDYENDVRCGWCLDEDDDGVCDDDDLCPGTPAGEPVNDDGCSCSQIVWVDGNECTYDWCEAGVGHHDPLTGTPCGPFAECPADTCEGTAFIDWTEGDYGLCSEGECIDYQCTYVAYPDDVRCGWCPDEDGDGVCDDDDLCPGTPAGEPVNDDGCSCSQIVCADGNVCTDDVCDPMTATCSYPYNDADCGLFRQCPEDYCDGASYVDWSASASDRCHEGSCMQYVCTYAVHAYDERCYTPQCAEGETRPCGSNIGICIMGYQACDEHGFWSACEGGVGPGYETCDGLDNDCDLHVDEDGVCGDALGRDLSIPRAQVLTEVVYPGDQLRVLVETENRLGRTLKDLKVTVIVPDLGIRRSSSLFDLRSGKDHTDIVTLDLPYFSAARTVYDVRITVSNDEVARTKYREFILN